MSSTIMCISHVLSLFLSSLGVCIFIFVKRCFARCSPFLSSLGVSPSLGASHVLNF
ncbi:hypothetical protein Scep_022080 [Stephania cephalantha]|uniref:Uncharacterized protein n=1 Tax=Stephania cephalantha TaxID=152367 RepID=A0AAP0F5P8_9MAGN